MSTLFTDKEVGAFIKQVAIEHLIPEAIVAYMYHFSNINTQSDMLAFMSDILHVSQTSQVFMYKGTLMSATEAAERIIRDAEINSQPVGYIATKIQRNCTSTGLISDATVERLITYNPQLKFQIDGMLLNREDISAVYSIPITQLMKRLNNTNVGLAMTGNELHALFENRYCFWIDEQMYTEQLLMVRFSINKARAKSLLKKFNGGRFTRERIDLELFRPRKRSIKNYSSLTYNGKGISVHEISNECHKAHTTIKRILNYNLERKPPIINLTAIDIQTLHAEIRLINPGKKRGPEIGTKYLMSGKPRKPRVVKLDIEGKFKEPTQASRDNSRHKLLTVLKKFDLLSLKVKSSWIDYKILFIEDEQERYTDLTSLHLYLKDVISPLRLINNLVAVSERIEPYEDTIIVSYDELFDREIQKELLAESRDEELFNMMMNEVKL